MTTLSHPVPEAIKPRPIQTGPFITSALDGPVVFERITGMQLQALLKRAASATGDELAVLDVRETLAFSASHLIFSSNLSHNRLEVEIGGRLPRREVPIVVVDEDETVAVAAATRLRSLGYDNLVLLAGGIQQWQREGRPVYAGFNVRSKAFAECVEHKQGTPSLDYDSLSSQSARRHIILDSRTAAEYHNATIPGAVHVPGADLVRVARDLVTDDETAIVVACGGRTRSIIGAQSLIDAGVPNPVFALRNGTGGLRVAGHTLEQGASRYAPAPSASTLAWADSASAGVYSATVLAHVEHYHAWRDDPSRTLYTFDLRDSEEFARGHVDGAVHLAGGQLIQEIDQHAPVTGARIVLIDNDDLVRARMTAHWLTGLGGFEIGLFRYAELAGCTAFTGDAPDSASVPGLPITLQSDLLEIPHDARITAAELANALIHARDGDQAGVVLFDLSRSPAYRRAHVPGARWILRDELGAALDSIAPGRTVVLLSEDGVLAALAWRDTEHLDTRGIPLRVLNGGTNAWLAAGFDVEPEQPVRKAPYPDVWLGPQARGGNVLAHVRAYLAWEVDLVRQVEHDAEFNALTTINR